MTITQMSLDVTWFVFYVQGRKEHSLCTALNEYEDIVAFVPMMERKHSKQGMIQLIEKELFPGYLFIKTHRDQSSVENLFRDIRQKRSGFKKFLKVDEEGTSALTQGEIEFLEEMLDASYVLRMSKGIIVRDVLHVQEGPLQGHETSIKKIDRHKCICKLYAQVLDKEVLAGLEIKEKIDCDTNSR